ncbi:antitoxin Xre-like helix-turn-helix domain-containing protein [Marinimicrobium sp. ABcell2]|uniref:antitoxin Xre-like helix-turn-helix domain-containing protein n=1 Tax=Marinimicrobium sp. ABcell2 TaxID=3069751 RepID=UPI0027ADE8E9|nr:antitoxin Xre-like helix-turn-helix domain-containing protein [Marinimicrobium sp. ABcell2]MDQ2077792.1 hypothetical protein [Marinimicrobium sp. ABcell2]
MAQAKLKQQADKARMAGAGLAAAFNILEKWGCDNDQQQAILSLPRATFYKYRDNPASARLSADQLERISYLLNMHASLGMVFENPENRYGFMSMKNHNPFFNGAAPLDIISTGSFAALYETFKRIDGLRGGQW